MGLTVFALALAVPQEWRIEPTESAPEEETETEENATSTEEGILVKTGPEAPVVPTHARGEILALIDAKVLEWGVSGNLVYRIITNESGFDPLVCNKLYGCRAGQGLMQIIPSTLAYCELKLGRDLNAFVPEDNLDCGLWLLKYEGIHHWEPYSGPYAVS